MSDTREVNKSRIKPLHVKGKITAVKGYEKTEEEIHQDIAQRIAEEFTRKLFEFNKVRISKEGSTTHFEVTLEVIVPDTPE